MRILTIAAVLVLSASAAFAFPIKSYDTLMQIQTDSSILVTETIVADFTGEPHHGIYRDIPLSGKDRYGNNYRIRHEILGVTDEKNQPLQTSTTGKSGRVRIRIGDPDVYVSDVRTYIIRYKLLRAVHFFDQHAELYWNVVGPEWEVPIETATATVVLPQDVPQESIQATSFSGLYGSTTTDARYQVMNGHSVRFWMTRALSPGEAMTIVVGWPKGIIRQPVFSQEAKWFIADNGYFFLPLVFLVFIYGLWSRKGKDPDTGRSEVVTYDPPENLRPAELGTLIDEDVDMRDISASIIDLAVRDYIHIKEDEDKGFLGTKRDYLLELQKPYNEVINDMDLTTFERELLRALFSSGPSRWVSTLTNHFYVHISGLRDSLYDGLVKQGYFSHRPDSVRKVYLYAGLGVAALGVISAIIAASEGAVLRIPVGWSAAIAICGVILMIASRTMPRKTHKGKNALLGARGFEEYLTRAEREDIEFQERQGYFEKFLPYAMAFGIAHRWAKAFEGIQTQPPSWYSGGDGAFHPTYFAHNMVRASESWGSAMGSQPRSQGSGGSSFFGGGSGFSGGSSGGGGGGGGGGGW